LKVILPPDSGIGNGFRKGSGTEKGSGKEGRKHDPKTVQNTVLEKCHKCKNKSTCGDFYFKVGGTKPQIALFEFDFATVFSKNNFL